MAKDRPQPRQTGSHQGQGTIANAFISILEDGGASVSILRSTLSSDPVLTGLQDAFPTMSSSIDRTPRDFFASSNDPFPEFPSFENYSLDSVLESSQYTTTSTTSSVNPRYLNSSAGDFDGVTSHQTSSDPWTHVDVTEPDALNPDQTRIPPVHLRTPTHAHRPSSGSGRKTFADSAYATGSRKSQHASEVDSIVEQHSECVGPRHMNTTPTPVVPAHSSSHSSTVTPTQHSHVQELPEEQRSSPRRSHKRQPELDCEHCNYRARTRSDLKKHSARHRRDYKCTFQSCQQSTKGFATVNDRDRHMKAVHNVNNRGSRSYKCFGEGCTKADKEWPRLDNFKQHLRKMHWEETVEGLLQLSNEWFDRRAQQQSADETASVISNPPSTMNSVMSVPEQFEAFQGFSPSMPSYNSGPSRGSEMTRSVSHGASSFIYPDLTDAWNPQLMSKYQNQRRSIPGPVNASNLRRPSARTSCHHSNLTPVEASVQRARSQVDDSSYQDALQVQNSFANHTVNYHFPPPVPFDSILTTIPSTYAFPQVIDNDPRRKVKKARTVAGPDLHSNRMREFGSPQEIQAIPDDLRGNQEDLLGFGSNPAADNAPTPFPHQTYQVNIIQPEERSPKSGLHKRIEDEINSFLAEHISKAGSQQLSDEEVIRRFRLSLHGSDTQTSSGASSIGPLSGRSDRQTSSGIHCPVTKETYFVCQVCQKTKKRQSDLNKHMQRHSKPYGCVFDKCQKTFGSKNDWKRHEQTQHEQQECWRCHLCFEVFFHDESHYVQHMMEQHSSQRPEESARQFRIPRNYQGRFWCGFCCHIVVHTKTDVEAINLRFDHIAHHFTKEARASKDWVELAGKGRTKQQIQDEQQSQSTTEAEEQDVLGNSQTTSGTPQSPSSQPSDSPPMQRVSSQHSESSDGVEAADSGMQDMDSTITAQIYAIPAPPTAQNHIQQNGSLRRHYGRQVRPEVLVRCCQCGECTSNIHLKPMCIDCNHLFCLACPQQEQETWE